MAGVSDRLRFKDRILDNVARAIKNIQEQQLCRGSEELLLLKSNDRACYKLCEHLDHVFMHGLRHINHGYWNVVTEFTRKDEVKEIKRLQNVTTDLGRGRAWLLMSLNECLLESYIRCYNDNEKTVRKHYVRDALLLDQQRVNLLLTLTSGLEYVVFELEYDVPYLDLGMSPPRSGRIRSNSESSEQEDDRLSLCSMDSIMSSSLRPSNFSSTTEQSMSVSDTSETTSLSSVDNPVISSFNNNKFDLTSSTMQNGSGSPSSNFDKFDRLDCMMNSEAVEDDIDGSGELEVIRVKGHKLKSSKRKKNRKTKQSNSPVCQQPLSEEVEETAVDNLLNHNSSISDSLISRKLDDILAFNSETLESNELTQDNKSENGGCEPCTVTQNDNSVCEDVNNELQTNNGLYISERTLVDKCLLLGSDDIKMEKGSAPLDFDMYTNDRSSSITDISSDNETFVADDPKHSCDQIFSSTDKKELSLHGSVQYLDKLKIQQNCDNHVLEKNPCDKNLLPEINSENPLNSAIDNQTDVGNSENDEMKESDIDDIYSFNQKSATSQLQDRVDNIINQSDATLHKRMFEEEPEETELYDDTSVTDKKLAAGEIELDNNTKLYLMLDIFDNSKEQFLKVFATRVGHTDGDVQPVFVLVTDQTLYFLNQKQSDNRFMKETSIPFSTIDYISLSISDQVIHIVCTNRRNQYWLTIGCQLVTRSIIETLSSAIDQTGLSKLSVLTDATTQKIAMRKYVSRECRCDPADVEIACYSLIHWDDPHSKRNNSDTACREGHLLYKIQEPAGFIGTQILNKVQDPISLIYGQAWKPAYVVLKDGLLCIYTEKNDSKPVAFVKMGGEDCVGCRRSTKTDREHCIEIIKADGSSWQMALATDLEANMWLQSLCQAVADGLEEKEANRPGCLPCCTIVTPQKLLMCHEDLQASFFRTLGSASIVDITCVLTDELIKSYCVLDFESRDAGSKDQWVLYFNSGSETQRFIQALSKIWSTYFQVEVPVIEMDDFSLQRKCREMAQHLESMLKVR